MIKYDTIQDLRDNTTSTICLDLPKSWIFKKISGKNAAQLSSYDKELKIDGGKLISNCILHRMHPFIVVDEFQVRWMSNIDVKNLLHCARLVDLQEASECGSNLIVYKRLPRLGREPGIFRFSFILFLNSSAFELSDILPLSNNIVMVGCV